MSNIIRRGIFISAIISSALFSIKFGENVIFHNVAVTAGADGIGYVNISGIEAGTYTVTENTSWSWAYKNNNYTVEQDITTKPTFVFENKPKDNIPVHDENNINNLF